MESREDRRKERDVYLELDSKGQLKFYDLVASQMINLDQKAQAIVNLEGLLLALMAVFSISLPSSLSVRLATWFTMIILLGSALCSMALLRVRWGTKVVAKSSNVEEGLSLWQDWRDLKLSLHKASLLLLGIGLFGLMIVLTLILLF